MKKVLIVLMTLMMVIVMAACGGSSGEQSSDDQSSGDQASAVKSYAGFYSAEIPDGFETDEYEVEFTRDSAVYEGEEEIIKVYVSYGDAEEQINSSVEYWADGDSPHQRVDDVTYGDITWLVETWTWNDDAASCTFYTNTEDGNYIEINFFMMAYDNEEVVKMMESFTFEEGAYDKNYDFVQTLSE